MTNIKYGKTLFVLTTLGVLFSGYLSAVKFFTSTCALSEPCPYFLGYPACFFGFGMFLVLFISTVTGLKNRVFVKIVPLHILVSGLGILFAAYFAVPELKGLFMGVKTYSLGLPTCAYGLVFYIAIFVLALNFLMKNKSEQ